MFKDRVAMMADCACTTYDKGVNKHCSPSGSHKVLPELDMLVDCLTCSIVNNEVESILDLDDVDCALGAFGPGYWSSSLL